MMTREIEEILLALGKKAGHDRGKDTLIARRWIFHKILGLHEARIKGYLKALVDNLVLCIEACRRDTTEEGKVLFVNNGG